MIYLKYLKYLLYFEGINLLNFFLKIILFNLFIYFCIELNGYIKL